jgi:hypothetical protein
MRSSGEQAETVHTALSTAFNKVPHEQTLLETVQSADQ